MQGDTACHWDCVQRSYQWHGKQGLITLVYLQRRVLHLLFASDDGKRPTPLCWKDCYHVCYISPEGGLHECVSRRLSLCRVVQSGTLIGPSPDRLYPKPKPECPATVPRNNHVLVSDKPDRLAVDGNNC